MLSVHTMDSKHTWDYFLMAQEASMSTYHWLCTICSTRYSVSKQNIILIETDFYNIVNWRTFCVGFKICTEKYFLTYFLVINGPHIQWWRQDFPDGWLTFPDGVAWYFFSPIIAHSTRGRGDDVCNCKYLKYLNLRKCNSIGVWRIWVGGQEFYFWHSAYTLSGESRDLYWGYGGMFPRKILKKNCAIWCILKCILIKF